MCITDNGTVKVRDGWLTHSRNVSKFRLDSSGNHLPAHLNFRKAGVGHYIRCNRLEDVGIGCLLLIFSSVDARILHRYRFSFAGSYQVDNAEKLSQHLYPRNQ